MFLCMCSYRTIIPKNQLILGWKPRRTMVFISWDAEEYGLVGSLEWLQVCNSKILLYPSFCFICVIILEIYFVFCELIYKRFAKISSREKKVRFSYDLNLTFTIMGDF